MRRIGGMTKLFLFLLAPARALAGIPAPAHAVTWTTVPKVRRARLLVLPLAMAALLLPAAPASSSLAIVGFTWYSDGGFQKSVPSGTVIVAYATGAKAGKQYLLQATEVRGGFACSDVLPVDVNPNPRTANSGGFIANTAGVVNKPPGNYEICFYELPKLPSGHSPTATAPAYIAIL